MPYIQMHVGSTKRHCGNIVQFVHQAPSHLGGFSSYNVLLVTAIARAL